MAGGANIGVVWTGRPCYTVTLLKTLKHTVWHCDTPQNTATHCSCCSSLIELCCVLHCVLREVGRTQSVISCEHRGLLSPSPRSGTCRWKKCKQLFETIGQNHLLLSSGWLCCREEDKGSRLRAEKQEKQDKKEKQEKHEKQEEKRKTGGNRRKQRNRRKKEKQEKQHCSCFPLLLFLSPSISSNITHSRQTDVQHCLNFPSVSVTFIPPFLLFLFGFPFLSFSFVDVLSFHLVALFFSICFHHLQPSERKSLPPRIDGFLENWRHFVAL